MTPVVIDGGMVAVPARQADAVPGGCSDPRRLAWQREMERAQALTRFKAASPFHPALALAPMPTGTSAAPGRDEERVPLVAHVDAPRTPAALAVAEPHVPASAAPLHPIAAQLSPPQALRVHLQHHDEQVHVWLGMDAKAQGQLPELVRALGRWLGEQGLRLRSVVCNGQVHFDAGADPDTPPMFPTSHSSTRRT
jgi:hypothetical protein